MAQPFVEQGQVHVVGLLDKGNLLDRHQLYKVIQFGQRIFVNGRAAHIFLPRLPFVVFLKYDVAVDDDIYDIRMRMGNRDGTAIRRRRHFCADVNIRRNLPDLHGYLSPFDKPLRRFIRLVVDLRQRFQPQCRIASHDAQRRGIGVPYGVGMGNPARKRIFIHAGIQHDVDALHIPLHKLPRLSRCKRNCPRLSHAQRRLHVVAEQFNQIRYIFLFHIHFSSHSQSSLLYQIRQTLPCRSVKGVFTRNIKYSYFPS